MRFTLTAAAILGMWLATAVPASAGPILSIVTGDGEMWFGGAAVGGGSGTAVVIDPHPLWQVPGSAQWVSYGDTGYGGSLLAPPSGQDIIMTVFEWFLAEPGALLTLRIWADDTARVLVDGTEVFAPNFTQNICANGSIGCEPWEFGFVQFPFLTGGLHTLAFETFQVGTGTTTTSNPFGLLYEGTVEGTESIPEPASIALLGLGLAAAARKRWRARAR